MRSAFFLNVILTALCGLAMNLYLSVPARAQAEAPPREEVSMARYSATEKVGFAFYHLTRHHPPLDEWIYATEAYQKAAPKVRLYMMDAERVRLKTGFESYTPDRDPITIRSRARIRGMKNPMLESDPIAQDLQQTRAVEISFPAKDDVLYFPFQVGQLWIAVLAGEIGPKTNYGMTEAQFNTLAQRLGMEAMSGTRDVQIEMVVLPIQANGSDPLVVNETPLWPMLTELGAVSLLDDSGKTAWTHSADWFASEARNQLLMLQR